MNNPLDRINTLIEKLALRAEQTGEVLFDGQWMAIEEAEQRYRQLKLDSRLKIAELIFLLSLIFVGATMPFIMLGIVGGIVG